MLIFLHSLNTLVIAIRIFSEFTIPFVYVCCLLVGYKGLQCCPCLHKNKGA